MLVSSCRNRITYTSTTSRQTIDSFAYRRPPTSSSSPSSSTCANSFYGEMWRLRPDVMLLLVLPLLMVREMTMITTCLCWCNHCFPFTGLLQPLPLSDCFAVFDVCIREMRPTSSMQLLTVHVYAGLQCRSWLSVANWRSSTFIVWYKCGLWRYLLYMKFVQQYTHVKYIIIGVKSTI